MMVGATVYVGRNVPLKNDLQVTTNKIGMDNKSSKGIFVIVSYVIPHFNQSAIDSAHRMVIASDDLLILTTWLLFSF